MDISTYCITWEIFIRSLEKNYETFPKFMDLVKGVNIINFEMSIERYCNLHIYVYN